MDGRSSGRSCGGRSRWLCAGGRWPAETHAPHRHVHEEIILVVEGSVILFGSNQLHSARTVGTVPCRYYVVELRGDE